MRLGFIGFGEVGYEMSSGFLEEGLSGIVAYDPLIYDATFAPLVQERARLAKVQLLESHAAVALHAEVIIAAVPGSEALTAARQTAPALGDGRIYADVSTSSPTAKKAIARTVEGRGTPMIDCALMGILSLKRHQVPTLISGTGSDRFREVMEPYGMSLEKVSEVAGDAIAVKLVRSIYMKGLTSLAVEMLQASSILGITPLVLKSISNSLDGKPFEEMMDFLVTASGIHAERQTHEMEDVIAMLDELGVPSAMTQGTKARLEWLGRKGLKEKFKGKKPEGWEKLGEFWNVPG
jgi:3-hydroxyisobutyrate dehydrogenase-like beta-hydroxyacid dehydrogenase